VTFVIGVDGGGTRARAVIVDLEGRELARGEATGAVVTVDDPDRAADAVRAAVHDAAEHADFELPAILMWAGLAGAGGAKARDAVTDALDDGTLGHRLLVGTDVGAAFHDAFGVGPGILLIGGTGSIAWARGASGEVHTVGGWGYLLGDEGSGYAIGSEGLRRLVWSEDGRAPPTIMRDAVLEACGVHSIADLVEWRDVASKAEVAAAAPVVVDAAEKGDAAAAAIIASTLRSLVTHVDAALEATGPWTEPAPLVLWGGLLDLDGPLRTSMQRALADLPIRLESSELDPAMGAARLALGEL
jgi:glucosamine kinase